MKKLFTFLASVALLGAMTACSSDEPAKGQPDVEKPTGDAAYLSVKIVGVDGGVSRSTTDGQYDFGTLSEHEVNNAKFYFYNEDGTYAELEATLINDPKFGDGDETKNDNIEYIGKDNIIVINGMKKGEAYKYPTYMLTVLNVPDDFTPGATLTTALKSETNWYKTNTVTGGDGNKSPKDYFVMSTTSYYTGTTVDKHHDDDYYFVTKLDKDEFSTSLEKAKKATPIDIYVERLASKVEFKVATSLTPAATITKEYTYTPKESGKARKYSNYKIYKLQQTVGGGTNPGESTGTTEGSTVTSEDLYIHILDWNLGATNPSSYMSKNIASLTEWNSFATTNWGISSWNDATRFRSYWAKSTLYNKAIEENSLVYAVSNKLLEVDQAAYCNEYTNKPDKIFVKNNDGAFTVVNPAYTTHATIHARVCDEKGEPINLIMANGLLYKRDSYLQKILDLYTSDNNRGNFKLWLKKEDGTYSTIDKTYFTFKQNTDNEGVGHALIQFDDSKAGDTFYKEKEGTVADGEDKYELITDAASYINEINTNLKAVQNTFLGTVSATIYDGGHFVYYVPIEHFGATPSQTSAVEGYYGVVRNHYYNLSITELTKVGHGIWNPEKNTETLKPDGPQEYYYLGARINILSWKIVNQSVHL